MCPEKTEKIKKLRAKIENIESELEWTEFKIGDLFEKLNTRYLGEAPKIGSASTTKSDEFCVPLVNAKVGDNGVMYWAKEGDFETHENAIAVVQDGAVAAGLVYAHKNKVGVYSHSHMIALKNGLKNHNVNLFLSAVLTNTLYPKYSRDYIATWGKIKNDRIFLPTSNKKPFFYYMEKYIELITNERISQLAAYLKASGLNNFEITKNDFQLFNKTIETKMFKLACNYEMRKKIVPVNEDGIFEIKPTKKKINANVTDFNGAHPYIARGESNNGVRGFITENLSGINKGKTIAFGQDTATMFYQKDDYFTGDKIQILSLNPKYGELDELLAMYLISAIKKSFSNFRWGAQSFAVSVISEIEIELPINNAGMLDLNYMRSYAKVVQKMVIKNTAEWTQKELDAMESCT
ncbi:restriction endonuclease subunit S [Lederbergia citrisecunda]|uniref:restriction endonuclease subunit S n=1 Tax=Lederbergia citrisecunda TaxID=2833583 RepID=UPI003D2AC794